MKELSEEELSKVPIIIVAIYNACNHNKDHKDQIYIPISNWEYARRQHPKYFN